MIVNLVLYYRFLYLLLFSNSARPEPICPAPYSCIYTKDCAERHAGTGTEEVLFQCARKTKVCCPPAVRPIVVNPTFPDKDDFIDGKDSKKSEFASHRNANLLPKKQDCGVGNYGDKITEGQEAVLGEFPWMALLGFKEKYPNGQNSNKFLFNCGGTLINSRYVLTAAHCTSVENRPIEFVRLGEHNLSNATDCNKDLCLDPPEDIPVERILNHPGWNATTIKNDIALLRLSRNALSSRKTNIVPICLPLEPSTLNITDDIKYEIAGWGKTEWNSLTGSEVLRKAVISGVSLEECNICKEEKKEQYCPITQSQICVQGWKSVDVCKGDSGGPLMLPKLNRYQIGITSFKGSEHCGGENIPSIFTNVTDYMPWILDNISA